MTTAKMSKSGLWIAAFLVGSGVFPHVGSVLAQTALLPDNSGIRGSINQDPASGSPASGSPTSEPASRPADSSTSGQLAIPTARNQRNQQQRARAASAASRVSNPLSADGATRSNLPAAPVQEGNTPTPEADPFAPTGFRIGTFEANATLEQAVGYSSNLSGQVGGNGGAFSQTNARLSLTSDWSRHELQTTIDAGYRRPFNSDEINEPSLLLNSALRLDLADGYTLTGAGFYTLGTQGFTSSTLAPGAVDNPLTHSYGGSLELAQAVRRLQFTLRGSVERDIFTNADLGGGVTVSQSDRNNTDYGIAARVGYEISTAVTPFVEASYTLREFDRTIDRNGNRRDSDIYALQGGVELDFGEKLQGEIALGYLTEQFTDAALNDLNTFTLNGNLQWSPERETTVGLTVGTQTNSSITADENGSVLYNARLDFERQITARLGINAFADIEIETNDENDRTYQFGFGTEYWVSRFMALTADVEYGQFTSDDPNSGFNEISGRMGVRLQR